MVTVCFIMPTSLFSPFHLGLANFIVQSGRADYILWGEKGALTGYLNYRTEKEGQPGWSSTGAMGSIAAGLGKPSSYCRLADLNGDVSFYPNSLRIGSVDVKYRAKQITSFFGMMALATSISITARRMSLSLVTVSD